VAVGLVVSIDFFNVMYPEKEAFLDQTFTAPRDATANEPAPTDVQCDWRTVARHFSFDFTGECGVGGHDGSADVPHVSMTFMTFMTFMPFVYPYHAYFGFET
jgi:hypothetical protein